MRANEATFATQQAVLDKADEYAAAEAAAVNKLKPELSFDKLKLNAEIVKMADAASVGNRNIGSPVTKTASSRQLAISSIKVTLNNVDMSTLLSFYRELGKRAPYITIADCTITARPVRGGRGGGGGFGGAGGLAGQVGTFRGGVAAIVQNNGNGVTDSGATVGGGRRGAGLAAATDPNADPTAQVTGRRGNGQPVLPGNMNVTFTLTAVEIIPPGAPAKAKPAAPATAAAAHA